jgi:hypothetical protein
MSTDLAGMFEDVNQALAWNSTDGESWTFAPESSFQSEPPYDLKPGVDPIAMTIDLGTAHTFSGLRIDGGKVNADRNLPNGFPDRFYFMYSDDGRQWNDIPGSEATMTDRSLLVWEW